MSKGRKTIISILCIILGYVLGIISWGGIFDLGSVINTILFCCSTPLIIGGFVYLVIVLFRK